MLSGPVIRRERESLTTVRCPNRDKKYRRFIGESFLNCSLCQQRLAFPPARKGYRVLQLKLAVASE
ncbi:MAG TPA: hypothetical protein DCG12_12645 [Planctomycetaceae bacterium]|nr:hypothetical protein [Planctomycetaceae bacterium]